MYKVFVTYRDENGCLKKGVLLDERPTISTTGVSFHYVDNFANRIKVTDVLERRTTRERW